MSENLIGMLTLQVTLQIDIRVVNSVSCGISVLVQTRHCLCFLQNSYLPFMSPDKLIAHIFNFQNFLTYESCDLNLTFFGLENISK